MKAEELMIGDWYWWEAEGKKYPYQVTKETFKLLDEDIANFQPIPLTEEILEKNGFANIPYAGIDTNKIWLLHELPYYGKSFPLYIDDIMLRYSTTKQCWCLFFDFGDIHSNFKTITNIFYVHELQHALKLCKIEKEISL